MMLAPVFVLAVAGAGCRAELGESDYASQESFAAIADAGGDGGGGSLSGPDPFEEGQQRLAIGAFYEGGSSIEVPIDEITTHLYVYDQTLSLQLDPERVEGRESMRVSHGGGLWCGMGVHWDGGRPLTGWTTLHLSARSSDAAFADFEVGMNDASGTSKVKVSDYGFRGDGAWHTMTIPLADFAAAGLDLNSVQAPFVLLGGPGAAGSAVLIDAIYITAE